MPSPTLIRTTRLSLGLTQQQAGELVGASARTWRSWEAGYRVMPGSKWELWEIKTRGMEMPTVVVDIDGGPVSQITIKTDENEDGKIETGGAVTVFMDDENGKRIAVRGVVKSVTP